MDEEIKAETTKLELAQVVQFNESAEAEAIKDYTSFLQQLENATLDDLDKRFIKETINEIISDELNHQSKLKMVYQTLTGIKENKN